VFPRLDNVAVTEIALPERGTGPAGLLSFNVPVGDGAPGMPGSTTDPSGPSTKELP
jgi:hypothetical protein